MDVSDPPVVVVTCVHGTWARASRWAQLEESVAAALNDCGGPIEFRYFRWSGRDSLRQRTKAAAKLRLSLEEQVASSPITLHVVIAHSHGANIVLHALDQASPELTERLAGIVLLSAPFLDCALVVCTYSPRNESVI